MLNLKKTWLYILFILSIIVAGVANQLAINNTIKDNLDYQQVITYARKQRTQSQKLSKLSYQVFLGEDKQAELSRELQFLDSLQSILQNTAGKLQSAALDSKQFSQKIAILTGLEKSLYAGYQGVASGQVSKQTLKDISVFESQYLRQIEEVIQMLAEAAQLHLDDNQRIQKTIILVSALILIIEIFVFVVPYHRKLLYAFKQLKIQKNEIERQKQLLDVLSSDSLLAYWCWSNKDNSGFSSPSFKKLYGYEDLPDSRETWIKLLDPVDLAKLQKEVADHFAQYKDLPLETTVRMRHKDGHIMHIANKIKVMEWDDDGKPATMIATQSDVTPIIEAKEQQEKLNQTKDKLFSIIAHDLRGPIINMKYLIELQQDEVITQEEFITYIDQVKDNVTYLSDTMDNLLVWAQGQMKGFTVKKVQVNIKEVATQAVNLLKEAANNKGIIVSLSIPDSLTASADRDHTFLILRNLLNNAIKFTPEEGNIDISAGTNGSDILISVKDSGIGMDTEAIHNIKNKNTMFTTVGTKGEKGTGLGLDLCFEMAEKNGGNLDIISHKGDGSTFILALPAS